MQAYPIIDADAHVVEAVPAIRKYLQAEYQSRPIWTSHSWDMDFGGTLGKQNDKPEVQLADMDAEGISAQVIFPSRGLSLNFEKQTRLAVDVARAYNDWLAEFCSVNPRRLKGVALVALQDIDAAIKEARRAVEELGHVAIMLPTNVKDEDIGRREFWPFYEAVEPLGAALALHGGTRMAERMHGRFETFISVHTIAFPFECMTALTGLMFSGVPEVFPGLRFAALEAGCGWVPYLVDRMDEEFEKRGAREAPLLKAKPSEYFRRGQFYVTFELEERMLPYVIERLGADKLLFSSDYPHWDTEWPHAVQTFTSRDDVSDADKRLILCDNPQRFFGFKAEV
jgi:uncharacterized protein